MTHQTWIYRVETGFLHSVYYSPRLGLLVWRRLRTNIQFPVWLWEAALAIRNHLAIIFSLLQSDKITLSENTSFKSWCGLILAWISLLEAGWYILTPASYEWDTCFPLCSVVTPICSKTCNPNTLTLTSHYPNTDLHVDLSKYIDAGTKIER